MRIPTTEFCVECEATTPKDRLAKTGRDRVRVYQDLDTGEYSCEHGHKVTIESGVLEPQEVKLSPREAQLLAKGLEDVKAGRTQSLEEVRAGLQPAQDTAVAVAEEPQKPFVLPGSARIREDHRLVVELSLPEQFAASLTEFCNGAGRTVEEYLSEFMDNACQNGWLF